MFMDLSVVPHLSDTKDGLCLFQQNNLPHGQPYTGPAAQHMNNPQRPGPRAQENWEPPEEVPPAQTKE